MNCYYSVKLIYDFKEKLATFNNFTHTITITLFKAIQYCSHKSSVVHLLYGLKITVFTLIVLY